MTEEREAPRYDTCGAPKRSDREPCTRPAGWGTGHPGVGRCKLHGGSLPNNEAAGIRDLEERRARTILQRLEQPEPIEHPVYELLKLAAETRAWQHVLRERMAELPELNIEDRQGVDRERALVALYERSLDRSAKLLVDMAKLDLKARSLALQQEQARQIMADMTEALQRAGLGEHELTVRTHLQTIFRERTTEAVGVTSRTLPVRAHS